MWATGVVTLPATAEATGLVLRGIRLQREPFLRLLDEYATAVPSLSADAPAVETSNENRSSGGKKKWKEWDQVWATIVDLALDDRLNRAEFPSQARLMEEVRNINHEELFSDRILKGFISRVYKQFVQPRG